jgi:hypothetical protein
MRILLVVCIAVIAGLIFYVIDLRSDLEAIRATVQTAQDAERKATAEAEPLRKDVVRLTAERDEHRAAAKQLVAEGKAAPAKKEEKPMLENLLGAFGQLVDSPEAKTMMRREAVTEARKKFGELLKKWNLSKADADLFLEMVSDQEMASQETMIALFSKGTTSPEKLEEGVKKATAAQEESRTRMKSLLGDERYAEWEKSNDEAREKESTRGYREHLTEAGVTLNDTQHAELAKIVKAERLASGFKDGPEKEAEEMAMMSKGITDAGIAEARKKNETYQARVLQKATGVLTPDQVNSLQEAFRQENDEQDLSYKMIRNFMPPKATATPAVPAK